MQERKESYRDKQKNYVPQKVESGAFANCFTFNHLNHRPISISDL